MNKTILIGRMTKDVELQYTASSQKAYAKFTLAVDRGFKNKNGEKESDFIPCTAWGKTGELIAQYTKKGTLLGVSGRIQVTKSEKDGKTTYFTEVVVDEMQFLEKSNSNTVRENTFDAAPVDDGDIPF